MIAPRDSEDADERTGWLQDPRPRPFYSTRVLIVGQAYLLSDQINYLRTVYIPALDHYPPLPSDTKQVAYQEFGLTVWQFYKLPDIVNIPFNRLYAIP